MCVCAARTLLLCVCFEITLDSNTWSRYWQVPGARMNEEPPNSSTDDWLRLESLTKSIDLFALLIERRKATTPPMRCVHLRRLYDSRIDREKAEAEVEYFQAMLRRQKSNIGEVLRRLISDVASNNLVVSGMRDVAERAVSIPITELDLRAVLVEKQRWRELSAGLNLRRFRLEEIARRNLSSEKQLASACLALEERYVGVLARFDKRVGALSASVDALLSERDSLKKQLDENQDRLRAQGTMHIRLKKERDLVLMETFLGELESFRQNRAARIIQRCWRNRKERAAIPKKRKTRK